jgi:VanZ family protein
VNEIAELFAELLTGRVYISTKLDTNIDLVANNVGALLGFLVVLGVLQIYKRRKL